MRRHVNTYKSSARLRLRTPARRRCPAEQHLFAATEASGTRIRHYSVKMLAGLWISYTAAVTLLLAMGIWLMMPPPDFDRPGTVWITDANSMVFDRGTSFDVVMSQFPDGSQSILVQNSGTQTLDLNVSFALGVISDPRTTEMIPDAYGGFTSINTGAPATGDDGICDDFSRDGALICRFELEPKAARDFDWTSAPTWVKHRGSRWAVQTPYVRLGNVSFGYRSDPDSAPKLRLAAHLRLPSGSAVMAGPALSWDWNNGTADFETTELGQIAAPLVVDQTQQRYEDFVTFTIAAVVGAALGALPAMIIYTRNIRRRRR